MARGPHKDRGSVRSTTILVSSTNYPTTNSTYKTTNCNYELQLQLQLQAVNCDSSTKQLLQPQHSTTQHSKQRCSSSSNHNKHQTSANTQLRPANLRPANLQLTACNCDCNLRPADLRPADLTTCDLRPADSRQLQSANAYTACKHSLQRETSPTATTDYNYRLSPQPKAGTQRARTEQQRQPATTCTFMSAAHSWRTQPTTPVGGLQRTTCRLQTPCCIQHTTALGNQKRRKDPSGPTRQVKTRVDLPPKEKTRVFGMGAL